MQIRKLFIALGIVLPRPPPGPKMRKKDAPVVMESYGKKIKSEE